MWSRLISSEGGASLSRSCWRRFLFYSSVHSLRSQDWHSSSSRRSLNSILIFDIPICIQICPDDRWLPSHREARWLPCSSLISNMLNECDSGKYVLRSIRIQYVSALCSKNSLRLTNSILQTLSAKLNYYSVTSRLLSVRIFQASRRIGRSVLTVIYRCKAATSRCVYCSDYRHAAWCRLELQCARHKWLHD